MATQAASRSSLVSSKGRNALALEPLHLDQVAAAIRAAGRPLDVQKLAQALAQDSEVETSGAKATAERVKKYDHRCNYQEGERVFMDNRYGRSFGTITKIIRQPPHAFCDKAFVVFDDPDFQSKWESERSTVYFAIHSGRTDVEPVYVEGEIARKPAPTRLNAAATARLAKVIDKELTRNVRFQRTDEGWDLVDSGYVASPPRPHIMAERGGAPAVSSAMTDADNALSQGCYKAPLLETIDKMGEATIDDIKRNVQTHLKLGPADWETDGTGKIVWLHRLHAAIKHLKRVGAIDSPRREVYRRVGLRRESA